MLEKLISYFAKRHVLTNMILIAVLIGGVFAWQNTSKEELPAFTFDTVRVTVRYPGASAADVEYFVTKPIEEELRGLDGVYLVRSNSSEGIANISVELEQGLDNIDEVITEIRNEVLDVDLPDDVIDDPTVRVFKTSKKAILDIALIHKGAQMLDVPSRQELQSYARTLENQLLNLPQVHSINRSGYLQEEIQIKIYPDRLERFQISFNTVMREIKNHHIRQPAGTLETEREPKVTILSQLDSPEKLKNMIIQGGFEGQVIRLGEVAEIERGFEKTESINKVNGYEAVMFSVVKSASYGILESLEAVEKVVHQFKQNNLSENLVNLVLLDDESIDIRNRIKIISINGAIGFVLILIALFVFLDKYSGFWVALGIPFTFCFTMILGSAMGQTINGTTLAAVIIVMGIVVDDAIVVAENITRTAHSGIDHFESVVKGTAYVFFPIVASILTTCVAFIPLFYFQGHFGFTVRFIPPIIFLMLGASLFESLFILPGHMHFQASRLQKKLKARDVLSDDKASHWFDTIEKKYAGLLERLLKFKWIIFLGFIILLVASFNIGSTKMKFVMFPFEETRDIVLNGQTSPGMKRYDTAIKVREIEDQIIPYLGKEVVGIRTRVAHSRRGSAVEENKFHMIIEVVPKEERTKSANELIEEFDAKIQKLVGFEKLVFQKSRWGQSSGNPIELFVQQNDDEVRAQIVDELYEKMQMHSGLDNVEVSGGYRVPEYVVELDREKIKRLSISPTDVASTFRAALEGTILYEFPDGDEDIRVRLTTVDEAKNNIEQVLKIPVENDRDYLVPLGNIVHVKKIESSISIARRNLKRTTIIDAGLSDDTKMTPVEIAEDFEQNVFPEILKKYPTTLLSFGGEVLDTRESKNDFKNAILMVIMLIYIILAVLFNSFTKPLVIMLAIPFGVVGVILAFYMHGKSLYGFYACIGTLGLVGVVVNDAIIMLTKLDDQYDPSHTKGGAYCQISQIASTRLRAVLLTTLTTVVGVMPTAYGLAGYDAMLAEMMLALAWGLIFGTVIILVLVPCVYSIGKSRKPIGTS